MKKRTLFITIVIMSITPILALSFPQSEVSKTETKTFEVKPEGLVVVSSNDGSITVNSWDRDEVEVTMKKTAWGRSRRDAERNLDDIEIDISQRGNNLYIREISDKHFNVRFGLLDLFRGRVEFGTRVSFDINLPRNMNLDLTSDDGDIRVTDVQGEMSLNTDDGDIILYDVNITRLDVDIDDGDFRAENVKPVQSYPNSIIFVTCDDGEIVLRNVETETIDMNLDDANVIMRNVTVTNLTADLDDGDFEADITLGDNGRIRIWSDDGTVELWLPEQINAQLNLFAYSGRIRTNFPVDVNRDEGESWVRDILGNGNANIRIETSDGDIYFRHR